MCRSWFYKAANPPLRKADHLSLAIGDMAIEYSYKLGQTNEFKFLCEHGWFLQRQSHITYTALKVNPLFESYPL